MLQPPETITLGDQEWMSTNLATHIFRNGKPIYHAANEEEWIYASENQIPAFCHYENNPTLAFIFGHLYNYYAIIDENGLAPTNFTIPTAYDWMCLAHHCGGLSIAGAYLKSTEFWDRDISDRTIIQQCNRFNATPGGLRYAHGSFDLANSNGFWWTATNYDASNAQGINLYVDDDILLKRHYHKGNGFSVRCIKATIPF
jgi:uncharacterized protein (TIGR02145 family)